MNNMDKIYKSLNLDLFENFNIIELKPNKSRNINNPYYFTDEGIINKYGTLDNMLLVDLITGCLTVEKITEIHSFIESFKINHNIKLPKQIEENDLFWFKLIQEDKSYIKYVPNFLKNDLLDLLE